MVSVSGSLRKMQTRLHSPVQYHLPVGDELVPLNVCLGKTLQVRFDGLIHCVHCHRATKKSFNQGYCYPCFKRLAQCDMCIMKPEQCHYDAGTCREPDWGEQHCMRSHYVYLANTSGLKVGITRETQIPTRWMDQGAVQALPIMKVASRHHSGLVEVVFSKHMSDKTAWQAMLKGQAEAVDLIEVREQYRQKLQSELNSVSERIGSDAWQWLDNADVISIDYPMDDYPTKIKSLNLDKTPEVRGTLLGIKGQYLVLDTGVMNVRKFTGYHVTVCTE